MNHNIIGVALATVIGLGVAFLNYFLSKTVLLKAPDKFSLTTVLRQVIQVGYLVLVYFIGNRVEGLNSIYLLVGAVSGMTIPMLFLTKKLLTVNDSIKITKNREGDENG